MSPPRGKIEVILEKRGPLTLRSNDYVATGGEGSVYRAKRTIIKIYTDPQKMQQDGMPEKIKLLATIQHKYIVSPQGLVTDLKNSPIGYYMPFANGEPLSRVFTNDFRQREKFNDECAKALVDRMREVIQFAHDNRAVMVDANELNWLVALKKLETPEPRAIDIDSWAIGQWPAKVIMPSIRDWHSKKFDQLTDWFAWGIVTFLVFTGIHPYKGKLDGYKPGELERRMKDNASIFSPGVRLNRAVRDFNCIPGPLRDWYQATFQQGERGIPPSPFEAGKAIAAAARITHAVVTATGALIFDKLFGKAGDPVIRIWPCGIALLKSGELIRLASKRIISKVTTSDSEVIKVDKGWLIAERNNGNIDFRYINESNFEEEPIVLNIKGYHLLRYENRLFIVTEKGLTEIDFRNLGKPILSVGQTWGVMINATKWFDGVGIQDAMGVTFIVAPFGDKYCTQVRAKELDGITPITAKAGNRFISLVGIDKNGTYHKLEFTFDSGYKSYTLWQKEVDSPSLNVAILPKKVCATIVDDGELNIFVPVSGKVIKVSDKNITTEMTLSNWDDKVIYLHNDEVWQVRMK